MLAQRRRRRAQIVPRHCFRLLEEGRDIRETRANFRAPHRRVLQILDAGHRLAGAAVRHDAGEALAPDMEAFELAARRVVGDEVRWSHRIVNWYDPRRGVMRGGLARRLRGIYARTFRLAMWMTFSIHRARLQLMETTRCGMIM